MKKNRSFKLKSGGTAKVPFRLFVLGATMGCAGHCLATGYYGPEEYLSDGGKNVTATPEFYWELETKRLAKNFHPTEKPMAVPHTVGDDGTVQLEPILKATVDADTADFADAIKTGEIKPPDPAKATQANTDARAAVADAAHSTLPSEFDSEFADYHKGAYAYNLGPAHYDEAKKAWEALLNRPASERHYRTLWATFMLGKLAMKKGDADAVKWFEKTRELAKQGFADSLGMAADSYGWEGRSEWKQGHPDKAAPLYLSQLALGDESAIVSLKALIPDRQSFDGLLNFGPDQTPEQKDKGEFPAIPEEEQVKGLQAAAKDPLLRRLVTAHVLTADWGSQEAATTTSGETRSARWLKIITDLKLSSIEDAEYLGWLAYTDGDYKGAQHWLDLCKDDSAAANWLRSKLQLRAGQLDDAVKSLGKSIDALRSPDLYTGWKDGAFHDANEKGPEYVSGSDNIDDFNWSMGNSASGDLGGMHLEHGDFIQAMDILLKGGLWEDASFIAERILTADELKAYVDKMPAPAAGAQPPERNEDTTADGDYTQKMRNLLGRRLVREDRYAEAATYLTTPYDKIVKKYSAALKDGADESLPKLKRAKAWFTAAWLARYDGMELMGTEVAPDSFISGGDFESTDMAAERLAGHYTSSESNKPSTEKNAIPTSAAERQRLEKNKIEPDARYHYRYIAAVLAMKAAALMEDNTEELADVVNTGGQWVANLDEKLGDRYFQIIDKRCSKTAIGKEASAKHWFVDKPGPWSTEQQTAYDAMHKEYGDAKADGQ